MFNINDYEPVEERLAKFIADYPDFRIATELESMADNQFIVKAYIFRTYADSVAFATGYAAEKVTDRGVNANFALPNAETSAIGRALSNAGYAPKGKRMSREEAAHVNRVTASESQNEKPKVEPKPAFRGGEELMSQDSERNIDYLKSALGGEIVAVVPNCNHGDMMLKEGTSKAGKPYHGYVCTAPKDQQCEPVWYKLTAAGTWRAPEEH